jgi:hypothetical protein
MRVETQLSAFIENKAGTLAALAGDLAEHDVSIRAVTIATLADHAVVRLVVSDPNRAVHLLGERGVLVVTSRVLAIELHDEAGALAAVARQLGRAGVNIDYAYGSCSADGGTCVTYVHVSDLTKARVALARAPRRRPKRR